MLMSSANAAQGSSKESSMISMDSIENRDPTHGCFSFHNMLIARLSEENQNLKEKVKKLGEIPGDSVQLCEVSLEEHFELIYANNEKVTAIRLCEANLKYHSDLSSQRGLTLNEVSQELKIKNSLLLEVHAQLHKCEAEKAAYYRHVQFLFAIIPCALMIVYVALSNKGRRRNS